MSLRICTLLKAAACGFVICLSVNAQAVCETQAQNCHDSCSLKAQAHQCQDGVSSLGQCLRKEANHPVIQLVLMDVNEKADGQQVCAAYAHIAKDFDAISVKACRDLKCEETSGAKRAIEDCLGARAKHLKGVIRREIMRYRLMTRKAPAAKDQELVARFVSNKKVLSGLESTEKKLEHIQSLIFASHSCDNFQKATDQLDSI